MLLVLSDMTECNNMFSRYDDSVKCVRGVFARHAFWPPPVPGENNVWGIKFGANTFVKTFEKLREAKRYMSSPFERMPSGIKHTGDTVSATYAQSLDTLRLGNNTILMADTAEELSFIPNASVDAIVTDPPYCDNVMYSELADFYHAWLRLGLKDYYPWFKTEISPRAREIVKNSARHNSSKKPGQADKDAEDFFFQGLTRVFKESHRVLRDGGLFIFTFHHKEPWAWKSVLRSIVEAGFFVSAVYPVHAEMKTSTHLLQTGGIAYDIPFVCYKRTEEARKIAWESLKDEIYAQVEDTVGAVRRSGRRISDSDLFVITMGRCLEVYSKYWPNVMRGGQAVDVDTAVDDIEGMVDSLIKSYELKLLPAGLDETTQLYLLYIAGERGLTWDDLRKRFTTGGGFSLDEFNRRNYLEEHKGRTVVPTPPSKRLEFIEKEVERGRSIPLIDIVHYLYAVLESGLDIRSDLQRWQRDGLVQVLDLLYKKTGAKVYNQLREHAQAVGAGKRRLL